MGGILFSNFRRVVVGILKVRKRIRVKGFLIWQKKGVVRLRLISMVDAMSAQRVSPSEVPKK